NETMEIDPRTVTTADWGQLLHITWSLFTIIVFVVPFAFSFLVAHAVIPSLTMTGNLARRARALRPVFYIVGLMFFGLALYTAISTLTNTGVTTSIYANRLI
ncbi:MAG: hypothetical protein AAB369_05485, partial [Chloroflexota bacterium]